MKSEIDPPFAIQTPLLAFERICRRTGTIRKTCLFENRTDDRLEVNVRYGFREHSWVHLLAAESAAPAEPEEREQLTLDPGQTRVHVLLNTNSSSFPFDRFRGRIYFQEEENGRAERWVEISFEEIEELRDFEGYAAIDLGTSNSMISLYHLRRDAVTGMPRSPALEGRSPEIPSTVFIRDFHGFQRLAEGSCAVGEAALREYQQDSGNDPRSLQVGTKRLIGVRQVLGADARGAGGYVDPSSLLYMLGRFIRERSQNHGDVASRIRKLAVTFPPTWDYQQVRRWKEVFRHLGFADEELDLSLDEASAAGLFYIYQWTRDADSRRRLIQDLLHSLEEVEGEQGRGERYLLNLLSFDFGGGTIDIAFIEAQLTMLDETIRLRIALKGSDSLGYGGDQVTLAIFRILKRRLAMAISDPGRYRGGEASAGGESSREAAGALATPAGFFLLPSGGSFGRRRVRDLEERAKERIREMWEQLEQGIAAEELSWELEEAVDAVFPTRFFRSPEEPLSPEAKRNFGWLWDEAEGLKRELFRQANRRVKGITLQSDDTEAIRGGICIADIPEEIAGARLRAEELAQARIWVAIGEIYRTIGAPLENAV
ncbi:MAG: hypothetical protein ACE5GW_05760, partial [Planctomycetota bacterium]